MALDEKLTIVRGVQNRRDPLLFLPLMENIFSVKGNIFFP